MRRSFVRGALFGLPLVAAPLVAVAEQPLLERVGWARTGAERGGRKTWLVGAEPPRFGAAPAAVPVPAAARAPVVSETHLERSVGFKPRGWHRRAWTSGDAPPR